MTLGMLKFMLKFWVEKGESFSQIHWYRQKSEKKFFSFKSNFLKLIYWIEIAAGTDIMKHLMDQIS